MAVCVTPINAISFQTGFRERRPVAAQPTLASAIQIGDPVSHEWAVTTLAGFDAVDEASEDKLANASVAHECGVRIEPGDRSGPKLGEPKGQGPVVAAHLEHVLSPVYRLAQGPGLIAGGVHDQCHRCLPGQ